MLENNKGQSKWTIQSNWQHRAYKTQDEQSKYTTQYVLDNTMCKKTQIT
jgi:hypothetical protein